MKANMLVEVNIRVDGIHCWPDAPDHLAFLRFPHRHTMVIRMMKQVPHSERAVEFFELAERARTALALRFRDAGLGALDFGEMSCESIAMFMLDALDLDRCGVFEDGMNGAWVERIP